MRLLPRPSDSCKPGGCICLLNSGKLLLSSGCSFQKTYVAWRTWPLLPPASVPSFGHAHSKSIAPAGENNLISSAHYFAESPQFRSIRKSRGGRWSNSIGRCKSRGCAYLATHSRSAPRRGVLHGHLRPPDRAINHRWFLLLRLE